MLPHGWLAWTTQHTSSKLPSKGRFGNTQDADIKWKELDEKYHFGCQFPADLIAMNVRACFASRCSSSVGSNDSAASSTSV